MELKGKAVDIKSLEFMAFDYRNENPALEFGLFVDGTELSDSELDTLADKYTAELHYQYVSNLY